MNSENQILLFLKKKKDLKVLFSVSLLLLAPTCIIFSINRSISILIVD